MEEILEMELSHPHYDVVVIGGGAAGLMAAGTAAKVGNKVLLL
jgi:predicted flavoprotein YhiN